MPSFLGSCNALWLVATVPSVSACILLAWSSASASKDDSIQSWSTSIVILSNAQVVLGRTSMRFAFPDETKILGGSNVLCVVIGHSQELSSTQDRRAFHDSFLGGLIIRGTVYKADGSPVSFGKSNYSWSRNGYILANGEISSCMSPDHKGKFKLGDDLDFAEILASESIEVLGIFWESTNRFDSRL